MLKVGSKNVTALKVGTKNVVKVYKGTTQVWPTNSLSLSASSLQFAAAGQSQNLTINVPSGQAWTLNIPVGSKFSANKTSGTGTTTISISVGNNTTESAQSSVITVSSAGLTATCNCSQAAGAKVYGGWTNTSLTIDKTSFTASGGTSAMRVNVKRTWTWNGVAGSGGTETSTSSLASPSTSDNIASVSGNTLTVGSLGTTFKVSKTITVSAQTAHDATRVSATVTQAANYVTSVNSLKTRTLTYSQIGAGGGTSDCQWDSYLGTAINTLWSCTFASGATGTATDADAVGNFRQIGVGYSWTGPSGTITSLNGTTGAITATSRGTTIGNAITVTVNAIQNVVFDNPSSVGGSTTPVLGQKATGVCQQAGNYVTSVEMTGGSTSYSQASAAGGTLTPSNTVPTTIFTFSSGDTSASVPASTFGTWKSATTGYSWSGASGNFTNLGPTSGAVTVTSKGTTVSGVTSGPVVTRNMRGSWTPSSGYNSEGEKTTTHSVTAQTSQAANAITSYGVPTGRTLSVSDIPASGGSISSGTLGGTITQSRTYTSGSSDTITNPTVSTSSYSAAISGSYLGTTKTSRTAKGTLTYYYTCNGKQGSCSATVYQEANSPTVTGTTCDLTTLATNYKWTSGAVSSSRQENSYTCGYRVTKLISVGINQSGILPQLAFSGLRAYSCWGSMIQHQGDSYVDFNNTNLGENTATLTLNRSETNNHDSIPYVLIQLSATYNDGSPGAIPTYTWTGDVTSSGSLAIYSASGSSAVLAQCQLGPSTRSLSLQEDAAILLEQIESGKLEVSEDIKTQLLTLANSSVDDENVSVTVTSNKPEDI